MELFNSFCAIFYFVQLFNNRDRENSIPIYEDVGILNIEHEENNICLKIGK